MSDNQVPAEMPQEDVETKSKLDLILSKIAELWTNIQSKFTTLTNHINTKTTEINSNTNSRAGITRDEINAHTSIVRDQVNAHTAVKVEEIKSSLSIGSNPTSIYTYGQDYVKSPRSLITINQPCEILSIFLNSGSTGISKLFKMIVDDDIYFIGGSSGGPVRYLLSNELYYASNVPYLLIYNNEGNFHNQSILNATPAKLEKNISALMTVGYTLGTIKVHKNFSLEILEISSQTASTISYSVLARL